MFNNSSILPDLYLKEFKLLKNSFGPEGQSLVIIGIFKLAASINVWPGSSQRDVEI